LARDVTDSYVEVRSFQSDQVFGPNGEGGLIAIRAGFINAKIAPGK
jgi:hypothetical protein